jgi:hypothetical protein
MPTLAHAQAFNIRNCGLHIRPYNCQTLDHDLLLLPHHWLVLLRLLMVLRACIIAGLLIAFIRRRQSLMTSRPSSGRPQLSDES